MYSSRLPENFKKYASKISVTTSSIQYENDDVMRVTWGDDYSICCCVSATETGKELQFFQNTRRWEFHTALKEWNHQSLSE